MRIKPIIVFDSGIGGLSIYRPLKIALPQENIIYMSDPNHFPYGDKSVSWLNSRFDGLAIEFNALDPKLVVLACNTATTNIITNLRTSLKCPVIGVEPVIKPLSGYPHALALMTESSAKSAGTKQLLAKYGPHVEVYTPHGLATAIEYNDYDQVKKNIHEITKIVHERKIQAVGLSCTHYPLILDSLNKALPDTIFLEPSSAVVREVQRVLRLGQDESI